MLSKEQSRQRWAELRDLWNQFDPIGIRPGVDAPADEYESYVGPLMRLLEQNAPAEQLAAYIAECVFGTMGLSKTPEDQHACGEFAATAQAWFTQNWQGKHG